MMFKVAAYFGHMECQNLFFRISFLEDWPLFLVFGLIELLDVAEGGEFFDDLKAGFKEPSGKWSESQCPHFAQSLY